MPGEALDLAVVAARYNAEIVERLIAGCRVVMSEESHARHRLRVVRVPGVFELPQAAAWLAREAPGPDAIIALGAAIRGETRHHELIATACMRGLSAVAAETGVPVTLGVLAVENVRQARTRSIPDNPSNRGYQAARAALQMVALRRSGWSDPGSP